MPDTTNMHVIDWRIETLQIDVVPTQAGELLAVLDCVRAGADQRVLLSQRDVLRAALTLLKKHRALASQPNAAIGALDPDQLAELHDAACRCKGEATPLEAKLDEIAGLLRTGRETPTPAGSAEYAGYSPEGF